MQTQFTSEIIYPAIRRILVDPARVEPLIRLWEKQSDSNQFDGEVLLAAAVLMTGQQIPSPVTALSVSRGLAGQPVWEGLVYLALSLDRLGRGESLSPAFAPIVADAVQAACRALEQAGNHIHFKPIEK
jgi:hypothetical protein